MKDIKSKSKSKGINLLDKASNLAHKTKTTAARTKDTVEDNIRPSRSDSPTGYAQDKISEKIKGAGAKAERFGRKSTKKVVRQAVRNAKTRPPKDIKQKKNGGDDVTSGKGPESSYGNGNQGHAPREQQASPVERGREAAKNRNAAARNKEAAIRTKNTAIKGKADTVGKHDIPRVGDSKSQAKRAGKEMRRAHIRKGKKAVQKGTKGASKAAKKTAKGTVKTARKGVKTAQQSAKIATRTAKTSVKVAQQTAKAAQQALQFAKAAAKAAATGIKLLIKALVAIVKMIIAAVKALVTAIAAGGWVAVLIIVVICLIGFLISSPWGLFFSSADTTTTGTNPYRPVIQETVMEYNGKISDIIRDNEHDDIEYHFENSGYGRLDNWIDVLAIYAVKYTNPDAQSGEAHDVVEVDEGRVSEITAIFWEMNTIEYDVEEIMHTETRTAYDEYGYEYEYQYTYYTYTLHIRLQAKGAWEVVDSHGFSATQKELLAELLNGEYDDLFNELIGNVYMVGDGTGVVGTGDFIWPSATCDIVNSPFGPRQHPITKEWEFHLGVDIPAGAGTSVVASDGGTVVSTSVHDSYGTHILVDHGNGYHTLYAHMLTVNVGIGDEVVQGQQVGTIGKSGSATGYHLHFEIWSGGSRTNPLDFFDNYTAAW